MHEPTSAGAQTSAYRADIDGLRAIAVLAVVAFHAFPVQVPGGFVGVDVFFVISGFLITGLLLSALERGTFSLRHFYSRRVRRIFPALVVTLAVCWAFGWFALFPDEYEQLGRHVAYGGGFLANVSFWREAGYFDNAAETKPLLHLWSLGIEEQFYIVWPLLLYFAWRRRIPVTTWMPVLALVSFALNVGGLDRYPTATFYSPASRAWELALGGLLAGFAAQRLDLRASAGRLAHRLLGRAREPAAAGAAPASRSRFRDLEAVAGLAMILTAVLLLTDGDPFPGWWALLPTVGSVLLLDAGPGAWLNRTILASRPMVAIGLVSYPLYLWHWPLLSFARVVESQTPPLRFRLVAVGLAFVLATLTYWLVEKPFRYGGHASRKIWILALSMAAVTATGRITASRLGLPWRSTVQAQVTHQRALLVPDDSAAGEACKRRYGFDEPWAFCLLDRMDAPPTVALVGDSHARHLVAGLKAHFREVGENLVFLGTRLPIWGATRTMDEPYQQVTDAMLDIALETATVHTVIVSTKLKLETRSYGGRRQLEMLETTLERFLAAGKRVIYVDDVPKLDFEPRQCIRRAAIPTSKTKVPCAMERRVFDKKTAKHRRALAALLTKLPAVELFDAPTYLCDERYCHAMLDGWLLYRDKDHLSNDGDLWLGRKFAAEQADGALALGASRFVERQARDESARSELSPSRRAPQAKGRSKRSNEERAGGGTAEIAEPR